MGTVQPIKNEKPTVTYGSTESSSAIKLLAVFLVLIGPLLSGLALIFIVFMFASAYTAITSLTFPSLIRAFIDFPVDNTIKLNMCITLAIEGALAALFLGYLKKVFRFKSELWETVLSELFSFSAFKGKPTVISTLILDLMVGAVVGWVAGASGSVGWFTLFFGDYHTYVNGVVSTAQPIGAIIASGGLGGGGPGGGLGGLFGGIAFLIALIILIFIIMGIVVGAASGFTFSLLKAGVIYNASLTGAIYNAIREWALASVKSVIENDYIDIQRKNKLKVSMVMKWILSIIIWFLFIILLASLVYALGLGGILIIIVGLPSFSFIVLKTLGKGLISCIKGLMKCLSIVWEGLMISIAAGEKGLIEGAIVGGFVGLIQGVAATVAFHDKIYH
jgi:hypothetical protein